MGGFNERGSRTVNALTICQPYAHLIAWGQKRVENRRWCAPHKMIGMPLAIHAGKSRSWLDDGDEEAYPGMAFGAVVAVAKLVACVRIEDVPAWSKRPGFEWLPEHEHTEGPWCWVLSDVRRLPTPISWKGEQGPFKIPDSILTSPEPPVVTASETVAKLF